ncbi:MAG: translation elongation factor Ts [Vicinamibacterales bacterium]
MAISAADVKKLRDQTGAGMMDCKAALEEANGNFDEATTILRKKGLASAAKKAGRTTSEGLIGNEVNADHSVGVLVEVNCESDFVARTDDFQQLIKNVIAEINKAGDAANEAWLTDPNGPVQPMVAAVIGKLGENMAVPRFVRYAGKGYVRAVHSPGWQDRRDGRILRRDTGGRGEERVHHAGRGDRDAGRRGQPLLRHAR